MSYRRRQEYCVIACVVWNPDEYKPHARKVLERFNAQYEAAGKKIPVPYPNSVIRRCSQCDVRIAVGPRQREKITALERDQELYLLACLLCVRMLVDGQDAEIRGLGGEADLPPDQGSN